MHVLIISNIYPSKENPVHGIFIKAQVEALQETGIRTGVLHIELEKLTVALKPKDSTFFRSISIDRENQIPVVRAKGLNFTPYLSLYPKNIYPLFAKTAYKVYEKNFGKPDLIHAHFGIWAGYSAMKLSELTKIPYIVTEHSSYLFEKKYSFIELKSLKKTYSNANYNVAVSDSLKKEVLKVAEKIKVEVINNMVDTDIFKPEDSIKKENQIISVGRLVKEKGFSVLLKAFSSLQEEHKDIRLIIAGQGPEKENLIKLCKELGINNKVSFLEKLSPTELSELYNASLGFVLTSEVETFGIVYIEALACGIPVVATRCGGPEEFINPKNGFLSEINNPEEIKTALISLIEKNNEFNPLQLHQEIKSKYSKEVITDKLIEVYKKVLSPILTPPSTTYSK
jgi:L-malate glycosyltransferase